MPPKIQGQKTRTRAERDTNGGKFIAIEKKGQRILGVYITGWATYQGKRRMGRGKNVIWGARQQGIDPSQVEKFQKKKKTGREKRKVAKPSRGERL